MAILHSRLWSIFFFLFTLRNNFYRTPKISLLSSGNILISYNLVNYDHCCFFKSRFFWRFYLAFIFFQMLYWHFNLLKLKFWLTYSHNSKFCYYRKLNRFIILCNYFSDISYILTIKKICLLKKEHLTLLWTCQRFRFTKM